ncbi:hypothetical protein NLU14_11915 [Marinobacter sp. 71-i]|uniref:Uncharacterized protein n=1 Tax=Marinobacter iranensis TaxID=2962607 RepID=A0ABT5YB67_9GAMM|nr:hypothetical protein [Marinobacter iranensis]MDF0750929.1 hypothetical protein [Marinobacter iranensis]
MFTFIEPPTFEADARKNWTKERNAFFTRLANGEIWLLVIYKKAVKDNMPAHILKSIREVLENE